MWRGFQSLDCCSAKQLIFWPEPPAEGHTDAARVLESRRSTLLGQCYWQLGLTKCAVCGDTGLAHMIGEAQLASSKDAHIAISMTDLLMHITSQATTGWCCFKALVGTLGPEKLTWTMPESMHALPHQSSAVLASLTKAFRKSFQVTKLQWDLNISHVVWLLGLLDRISQKIIHGFRKKKKEKKNHVGKDNSPYINLGKRKTLAQKSHEYSAPQSYKAESADGDLEGSWMHLDPEPSCEV
eukprot:1140557-Pelagomonas_calceolata.AAC.10